jgi:hypothetical protein
MIQLCLFLFKSAGRQPEMACLPDNHSFAALAQVRKGFARLLLNDYLDAPDSAKFSHVPRDIVEGAAGDERCVRDGNHLLFHQLQH